MLIVFKISKSILIKKFLKITVALYETFTLHNYQQKHKMDQNILFYFFPKMQKHLLRKS